MSRRYFLAPVYSSVVLFYGATTSSPCGLPQAFLVHAPAFVNAHLSHLAEKTGAFPAAPQLVDEESAAQSMRDTLGWLNNLGQLESANSLYGTVAILIALYRINGCTDKQDEYVQQLRCILTKSEQRNITSLAESFATLTDPVCAPLFSIYLGRRAVCPFSAFRYQYVPADVRCRPGSMLQLLQAVMERSAGCGVPITARQVKSIVEELFPCCRKRKREAEDVRQQKYQQLWGRYQRLCEAYRTVAGEEWSDQMVV